MAKIATEQSQIYFDMDGVLADFIGGVEKQTGKSFISPDLTKDAKLELKAEIQDLGTFWHKLEWMPGAKGMWKHVKNNRVPHILSAYASWDKNCRRGKTFWIGKNLGTPASNINLVRREEKQKLATANGVPNILIDDHIKNIKEWEAAGGIGIRHTSAAKTISQLKKLGIK
jgi:hypothetical protein|tara:strand:- start:4305 stop:4817 length:513 start_codon:yes stop_codon:yes gene_type:complete